MSRQVPARISVVVGLVAAGCVVVSTARANAPALGRDDAIEVQIGGVDGVADDAEAAVLNVTAVDATAPGFLTVYPCDAAKPNASNVNYEPGAPTPNLVIARLSATGTVCVWASAPVSTIIDVDGWFPIGSDFVPLVPQRVLDSRLGNGVPVGKVAAGTTVHLALTGGAGLPATGLSAVVLNTTAANADQAGYATVYPCDAPRPDASNLNFVANRASPNLVVSGVAADSTVCLYVSATTDLIADVSGYFPTGSDYVPTVPGRVLDTRFGLGAPAGRVATNGVVRLQLPAGSRPVVLNTTVADATTDGFVTVYPCDVPRPDASNLNFRAGEAIPNLVITAVAPDGGVCFYTSAPVDLIADVNGWLPTDELYVSMAPERVLDGRHCNVAVYTVNGEIFADDFDLGYTNDLGPTIRPGMTVSAVLPPMIVSGDCWVYVKVIESVDGQLYRRLDRVSAKAFHPSFEPAPGELRQPLDRARVVGSSPDGRYIWLHRLGDIHTDHFVKVDTGTGNVQALTPGVKNAIPLSVTPDGHYALIQNPFGTSISVVDLMTGSSLNYPVPFGPFAFQLSPDGSMFAAQFGVPTAGSLTFRVQRVADGKVLFETTGELAGWLADGDALFVADGVMYEWGSLGASEFLDLDGITSYTDGPTVWWPQITS